MNDLITMTQAAKRMGCSREWVYHLIKHNRIKAQMVGGIYILRAKDVDACDVRPRAKPGTNGHTPKASKKRKPVKAGKGSKKVRTRSRSAVSG